MFYTHLRFLLYSSIVLVTATTYLVALPSMVAAGPLVTDFFLIEGTGLEYTVPPFGISPTTVEISFDLTFDPTQTYNTKLFSDPPSGVGVSDAQILWTGSKPGSFFKDEQTFSWSPVSNVLDVGSCEQSFLYETQCVLPRSLGLNLGNIGLVFAVHLNLPQPEPSMALLAPFQKTGELPLEPIVNTGCSAGGGTLLISGAGCDGDFVSFGSSEVGFVAVSTSGFIYYGPLPEPSSVAVLGVGLLGFFVVQHRKQSVRWWSRNLRRATKLNFGGPRADAGHPDVDRVGNVRTNDAGLIAPQARAS